MIKRFLPQSSFARNVATLMTGTAVAQALPIAISPILTRMYTPEQFGILALYVGLSAIAAVIVTGRYELAIMLPQKDEDAAHITVFSLILSVIVSAVLLFIIILFNPQISGLFKSSEISYWLYFVPISTLFCGVYQSFNYWSNRKRAYIRLATTRVSQSVSASIFQLVSGVFHPKAGGLIGGQIMGNGFAAFGLGYMIVKEDWNIFRKIKKITIFSMAKKYIGFPKYMIFGQLANEASSQMPVLLIGVFFSPGIAGFYSLSQRTLTAPMSLIGSAIGDVFRQEAAGLYNKTGNCKSLFLKTILKLIIFATLTTIPILLFGPWLFSVVFGDAWRTAGEIASVISVMVFFQTISSPLSQTVLLAGMQGIDLIWQLFRLFVAVLCFYIGYIFFNSYKIAIVLHVICFSFLYVVHSFLQYKAALGNQSIVPEKND